MYVCTLERLLRSFHKRACFCRNRFVFVSLRGDEDRLGAAFASLCLYGTPPARFLTEKSTAFANSIYERNEIRRSSSNRLVLTAADCLRCFPSVSGAVSPVFRPSTMDI